MTLPSTRLNIIADHREQPSGIPSLLMQGGAEVTVEHLATGDYVINHEIIIERKSADDFIQSLISDRLFNQCARLRKSGLRPSLLLEGDPYQTHHQIDHHAVKGALLSISVSWQIPVLFSENKDDTANQLVMLGNQSLHQNYLTGSYKPKRLNNHRLRFLQGLPGTGSVIASRLIEHFGSIEAIINADKKELQQVDGIGKKLAEKIRTFVSGEA